MNRLVGTKKHRTIDIDQTIILPGRQWLFDHLDPQTIKFGTDIFEQIKRPGFVGINNDAGLGRTFTHSTDRLKDVFAIELDLQQRGMGDLAGGFAHVVRGIDRQRFGCDQSFGRLVPNQFPNTTSHTLGFQVPIGAVDCITRSTGLHGVLEFLAGHATVKGVCLCFDVGNDTFDRFIIPGIGNAFPLPGMGAVADRHLDHMCLGPGPARDLEDLCEGEDFGNHSEFWQLRSPAACRPATQRRYGPGQQPEGRIQLRCQPEVSWLLRRQAPWC